MQDRPVDPAPISAHASAGENVRPARAPRGPELSCKGWVQEAALRLLMNSCDPEVSGKALQGANIHSVGELLQSISGSQTLLLNGGETPAIFHTDENSPRVLILADHPISESRGYDIEASQRFWLGESSNLSWTSAGEQSALCAAFVTLASAAQSHFGSDLSGKLVVAGGMGTTGGVLPLAATMNGAAFLGIEVDESKILGRIRAGFCDICVNDLDEALRILKIAIRQRQPASVGLVGNCADALPEMAQRGVLPDLITDRTGGRDRYIPAELSPDQADKPRRSDEQEYSRRSGDSISRHVAALHELQRLGAAAFEFGHGVTAAARKHGMADAAQIPDFVTAYLAPAIRAGVAPVRWFALSGERSDIFKMDELLLKVSPQNPILARWLDRAKKHVRFQGLPARVAWLAPDERVQFARRVNDQVARGELKAPVVFSRDFDPSSQKVLPIPEGGGVASGQTLQAAAQGAGWAAFERGNGQARLLTQAAVADGSPEAVQRLAQILSVPGIVAR